MGGDANLKGTSRPFVYTRQGSFDQTTGGNTQPELIDIARNTLLKLFYE